jgi:hypothetical protein
MALATRTAAAQAAAPRFAPADSVLGRIWSIGMDSTEVATLAQTLSDSIGPRLTGSPGQRAGVDWLLSRYKAWGVPARAERYGTWRGWRRGTSHIDLVAPRVRSLEGTMLAWSPGTNGRALEAGTVVLPDLPDSAAYAPGWRARVGRWFLISFAQPTCPPRPPTWGQWATLESFDSSGATRAASDSLLQGGAAARGDGLLRRATSPCGSGRGGGGVGASLGRAAGG